MVLLIVKNMFCQVEEKQNQSVIKKNNINYILKFCCKNHVKNIKLISKLEFGGCHGKYSRFY